MKVKRVMMQLLIVSVTVATYALPVLARGGAGY